MQRLQVLLRHPLHQSHFPLPSIRLDRLNERSDKGKNNQISGRKWRRTITLLQIRVSFLIFLKLGKVLNGKVNLVSKFSKNLLLSMNCFNSIRMNSTLHLTRAISANMRVIWLMLKASRRIQLYVIFQTSKVALNKKVSKIMGDKEYSRLKRADQKAFGRSLSKWGSSIH